MWLTIIILLIIVIAILVVGMVEGKKASTKQTGAKPTGANHGAVQPVSSRRRASLGVAGAAVAWGAASHLSGRHHTDNDNHFDSDFHDYNYEDGYEDGYNNGYDYDPEAYYDEAEQYGYDICEEYEEANDPEEYEDSY